MMYNTRMGHHSTGRTSLGDIDISDVSIQPFSKEQKQSGTAFVSSRTSMMRGVVSREGQMKRSIETNIDQTTDDLTVHTLQLHTQNSQDCDNLSIVHSSSLVLFVFDG